MLHFSLFQLFALFFTATLLFCFTPKIYISVVSSHRKQLLAGGKSDKSCSAPNSSQTMLAATGEHTGVLGEQNRAKGGVNIELH